MRYLEVLTQIKPRELQLYEIDRPCDGSGESKRISKAELVRLAEYISRRLSLPVCILHEERSRGSHCLAPEVRLRTPARVNGFECVVASHKYTGNKLV